MSSTKRYNVDLDNVVILDVSIPEAPDPDDEGEDTGGGESPETPDNVENPFDENQSQDQNQESEDSEGEGDDSKNQEGESPEGEEDDSENQEGEDPKGSSGEEKDEKDAEGGASDDNDFDIEFDDGKSLSEVMRELEEEIEEKGFEAVASDRSDLSEIEAFLGVKSQDMPNIFGAKDTAFKALKGANIFSDNNDERIEKALDNIFK